MKANKSPQLALAVFAFVILATAVNAQKAEQGVRLVKDEAARRIDVFIDGQPFTSYVWPETLTKPVLHPTPDCLSGLRDSRRPHRRRRLPEGQFPNVRTRFVSHRATRRDWC